MKAPFKRNQMLRYSGPDAPSQDVRYVKWMGFSRSALIIVELSDKRRITAHVSHVEPVSDS